jgi:hypothetical protein
MTSTLDRREEQRTMSGHDEELERLRAAVGCATVLEKLVPGWTLDRAESTPRALKYRHAGGDIIIVDYDERGWWDPHQLPAEPGGRGDVFDLVQRLDPSLNFGQIRQVLRRLVGIAPTYATCTLQSRRETHTQAPQPRWEKRPRLRRGSRAWRYLADEGRLTTGVLATATEVDAVSEGAFGSAWFAHCDNDGRLTGIEMRGPQYRGFTAGSGKSLCRLPGSRGGLTRLVVAEPPIDALSFAALERVRADTIYVATGSGMGPGTIAALEGLRARLATHAHALAVLATDADRAGERYAVLLSEIAANAGVRSERTSPPGGLKDWNDVLKARTGRGA